MLDLDTHPQTRYIVLDKRLNLSLKKLKYQNSIEQAG